MNDARSKKGQRYAERGWILALALLAPIISACAPDEPKPEPQATVFATPRALPAFELRDHQGEHFTRDSLSGQWSLVFFGFTNCPDICPLTLQSLARARRELEEHGGGIVPEIIFVSVDPERDTTDHVAAYVSAFGDGITGVVGELDDVNVLTSALGIFHARPANEDGGYDVEHSAAVVLVNDRAEYHALFSAPHKVEAIVADFHLIVDP